MYTTRRSDEIPRRYSARIHLEAYNARAARRRQEPAILKRNTACTSPFVCSSLREPARTAGNARCNRKGKSATAGHGGVEKRAEESRRGGWKVGGAFARFRRTKMLSSARRDATRRLSSPPFHFKTLRAWHRSLRFHPFHGFPFLLCM